MPVQEPETEGFKKWKDYVNKAVDNDKWDSLDGEIQVAVNTYNKHLLGVAGYVAIDWHYIKAILWVETGADSSEWNTKPMQIGVEGDPGLEALLSGKEGGDLILPPVWKKQLTMQSARTKPADNIRAGIGYLLMRLANIEERRVFDKDDKVYKVTVKSGDSLWKIADNQGSTVETLKELNTKIGVLRPGQELMYKKASMKRVIVSWKSKTLSADVIAKFYNGGGDKIYAKKIEYALSLVRKKTCAQ